MSRHWFLPQTPDVLGTLRRQAEVTIAGMTAYAAWADGDPGQSLVLRQAEHDADKVRRSLAQQLRTAFTTPIDAEDLFALSERLDSVLNMAKNAVRDADLLGVVPDEVSAAMAHEALSGISNLSAAIGALPRDSTTATERADAAVKNSRHIEKRYRLAIGGLAGQADLRRMMLMREHYHDCLVVGERIEAVADRVWYAVVKEQ